MAGLRDVCFFNCYYNSIFYLVLILTSFFNLGVCRVASGDFSPEAPTDPDLPN